MGKRYFLNSGDVISNLFIILMQYQTGVNKITYSQIRKFKKILEEEAENNGFELTFNSNKNKLERFFSYNESTFEEQNDTEIIIKEGVTPIHLIWDYRSHLPLDVFSLVLSDEVTNKTLNMMGYEKKLTKEPEDIEYYINVLKELIIFYASKMEFEKCIELRERLQILEYIQKILQGKEENTSEKEKTYKKINKDNKSEKD